MSEARKRLIEEMRKSSKEYTKRLKRYEPLSGMTNIEHQIEEARKKEQRVKEELKQTEEEQHRIWKELKKKTLIELSNFSKRIRLQKAEEEAAYADYMKLSKEAPIVPTYTRILEEIAIQEKKHSDTLTDLIRDIETKIKLLQKELQTT